MGDGNIPSRTKTTHKIRNWMDTSNHAERLAATIPVINEFAESARLTKMIVHFGLDVVDGKDLRDIKRGFYQRGAEILVDILPVGSAVTERLGIQKPLVEGVTRVMLAQDELLQLNPKGAWSMLKTRKVPDEHQVFGTRVFNKRIQQARGAVTNAVSPARRDPIVPSFNTQFALT